MTPGAAAANQPYVGFIRILILPGLLLWPLAAGLRAVSLDTEQQVLLLLGLSLSCRWLERRLGATWSLIAAALAALDGATSTAHASALLDVLVCYCAALSVSLALVGDRPGQPSRH
ncbi:hypothetical protein [Deinococcus multiflagellatus]|uniref:Uncharacterized protein n=1 Tax=Deinococcus multiflagellatus TaxID=1656887 RepID=A0ABW1ZP15_9DEIO|nr:hypothetical protein [Deinococcus multiflagellatus]MBZ9715775.1 hypothetical protein [Deinococcus multiflagellatus]